MRRPNHRYMNTYNCTCRFSNWMYLEYALAGYGALWFLAFALAMLSQSHINTGAFGLFGFPVIAAIYGFLRGQAAKEKFRCINEHIELLEDDLDRHFEATR